MAHPRHEEVRQRYHGRCGYCGVSEAETGGELTVDHFRPVVAGGGEDADNLVYCCFRCNTYKGDFFPNALDLQHGRRLLHPLLDPSSPHYLPDDQSGHLQSLTATGRFHIDLLRLNRPQLVQQRLTMRSIDLLQESHRLLQDENALLRNRIALLETYLRELSSRAGASPDVTSS